MPIKQEIRTDDLQAARKPKRKTRAAIRLPLTLAINLWERMLARAATLRATLTAMNRQRAIRSRARAASIRVNGPTRARGKFIASDLPTFKDSRWRNQWDGD